MSLDASTLSQLYPIPSRLKEFWDQTPRPLPGVTSESSEKLSELMRLNHERYHIYFNDRGYHNHMNHHLTAAWSFGAPPTLLREVFDEHANFQRKKVDSPEAITEENWNKHLGLSNEDYYSAYYDFFAKQIVQPGGISHVLEKYIFSKEANHIEASGGGKPMMLARLFGGVLHPLIHSGHIEFGQPGMIAEGVAQACVTAQNISRLFPEEFFSDSGLETSSISSQFASLMKAPSGISSIDSSKGMHSFTLVAKMLLDDRLKPSRINQFDEETDSSFVQTLKEVGDIIREYARLWLVPVTGDGDEKVVQSKIEELQWLAATIFGLGGWRKGEKFRSDFFLLHLLTSSVFLPSLAAFLSPSSQSALLRGHLAMILSYWVSRGRPSLPISSFYDSVTSRPTPPGPKPTPSKDALSGGRGKSKHTLEEIDNPWLGITQSVLHHPDEHLIKVIRTLEHYGRIYGARKVGWVGNDTGLKDAEKLDGTLFVRVAGNAMNTLGWVREGERAGDHWFGTLEDSGSKL